MLLPPGGVAGLCHTISSAWFRQGWDARFFARAPCSVSDISERAAVLTLQNVVTPLCPACITVTQAGYSSIATFNRDTMAAPLDAQEGCTGGADV